MVEVEIENGDGYPNPPLLRYSYTKVTAGTQFSRHVYKKSKIRMKN